MKAIPPKELDPGFDTSPHRAALRRAGVTDEVINKLPQGALVARGTLLLRAEDSLKASSTNLQHQVARLVSHGLPLMIGVAEAVAVNGGYLTGLRQGIEFATGSANDKEITGE